MIPVDVKNGELPLCTDVLCAERERVVELLAARGISHGASFLFVPETRWIAAIGVAGASALAMHYENEHPYPTTCHLSGLDKWQHCFVGCKIATWFPGGSFSASILAILKEVRDAMNHGRFSWPDVFATLRGAWDCASCDSCEACCCEQAGR